MRQSLDAGAMQARAATPASSQAAADASATHRSPANTNTTMTETGDSTNAASESQRRAPRSARNQYAAASETAALASPTASMAALFNPAKAMRRATATPASTKLSRASHGRQRARGTDPGTTALQRELARPRVRRGQDAR